MNVYEAGVVRRVLADSGFVETSDEADADVLLMMTCSVRSHAEARAIGRLGAFRALRSERPGTVIGVLGCMAQRHGRGLVDNERVDMVVGPDCYLRLPELLHRLQAGEAGLLATDLDGQTYDSVRPGTDNAHRAFVTVMRGCNNHCAYCVVPYVKGRERSRSRADVLDEVRRLVDDGVREVTLLGQNVLAYRDAATDFVGLLEGVGRVANGVRVRFLTSHPRDLDRRVLTAMRDITAVCPTLHLPVQSGSDRVLGLMNRGYTRDEYLAKVELARELVPDLFLSTDIIVGFPSETEPEFDDTLQLVQRVGFDTAYMFRYSSRPGTPATALEPRVSQADSGRRLSRLIEVQNRTTLERARELLGTAQEVLVESPSPRGRGWLGRTRNGRMVVIHGSVAPGELVTCRVTGVSGWTPVAEVVAGAEAIVGQRRK